MDGEKFGSLFHHLVHLVASLGLLEIEKHACNLVQSISGQLVGSHGVLECRGFLVVKDGIQLLVVLLDAFLDSRYVIRKGDLVERRNAIGCIPLLKKRVLGCASCHRHYRSDCQD